MRTWLSISMAISGGKGEEGLSPPWQCSGLGQQISGLLGDLTYLEERPMPDQACTSVSSDFEERWKVSGIGARGTHHEERCYYPIHNDTEPNLHPEVTLAEDVMERLEFDFAQDRIHHHQEANSWVRLSEFINKLKSPHIPIGTDTCTNFPRWRAGSTLSI